jgi:signal transduction histidine kinase
MPRRLRVGRAGGRDRCHCSLLFAFVNKEFLIAILRAFTIRSALNPFLNGRLLMNAVKYGGNQHGQVTITVCLSRRPGLYELCVQDEGFGFDLENPKSRSSGLGLVRALTQRLGGSFSVERTPGARCTVRFPDQ